MSELINEADSKAALPNTKKNPTEFLKQVPSIDSSQNSFCTHLVKMYVNVFRLLVNL
jgi:hypothetical protein